ncbi:unnamed protein product [Moneuplotes crassus]|uniref:Uncharacterized protein n=1 Tax=Euplotes crassus TaxID=5936 RepID=A0AAD1Y452_EUPCR|nr:unnamed protein product [Moneuplotes crassus]
METVAFLTPFVVRGETDFLLILLTLLKRSFISSFSIDRRGHPCEAKVLGGIFFLHCFGRFLFQDSSFSVLLNASLLFIGKGESL